jgi:hypothetical protein
VASVRLNEKCPWSYRPLSALRLNARTGSGIPPRRLMGKSQTLNGFYLPVFLQRPELIQAGLRFLAEATLQGELQPSIARVSP